MSTTSGVRPSCALCGREAKPLRRGCCNACYLQRLADGTLDELPRQRQERRRACAHCEQTVPIVGRGLCGNCYARARRNGTAGHQPKRTRTERFWEKVAKGAPSECWPWTGTQLQVGYGRFDGGYAHRTAWELAYGVIPGGLFICHRCDNPRCVNPDHLMLGTQQANMRDMATKGRVSRATKLTPEAVREIRLRALTEPIQVIAKDYPVGEFAIRDAVTRKTWRHVK